MRDRPPQGMEAIILQQQRVTPEGGHNRLLSLAQHRRARLLRSGLEVCDRRSLARFGNRLRVDSAFPAPAAIRSNPRSAPDGVRGPPSITDDRPAWSRPRRSAGNHDLHARLDTGSQGRIEVVMLDHHAVDVPKSGDPFAFERGRLLMQEPGLMAPGCAGSGSCPIPRAGRVRGSRWLRCDHDTVGSDRCPSRCRA